MSFDVPFYSNIPSYSGALIALFGLGWFVALRRINANNNDTPDIAATNRPRRLSINSSQLFDGVFPPSVEESPCVINSALLFDSLPSHDELVNQLAALLRFDRFKGIPVKVGNRYEFKTLTFDMNDLISTVTASSEEKVLQLVEEMSMQDINESHPRREVLPIWQAVRIENTGIGVSVLLLRIHHVISDGMGLVGALSGIFIDTATNEPLLFNSPKSMGAKSSPYGGPLAMTYRIMSSFLFVLSQPLSRFDSNINIAGNTNDKSFKNTKKRQMVILPTLKLEFIKMLKNKAMQGATVNDVLFTAVSGAVLRYNKMSDPTNMASSGQLI